MKLPGGDPASSVDPVDAGPDLLGLLGSTEAARFSDVRRLAGGGSSQLFIATDTALDRIVVLKVLPFTTLATGSGSNEVVAQVRVGSHSNVLTLYESGVGESGRAYLVLEHAPGGSLNDLIEAGPQRPEVVLERAVELACAVEAVHAAGVIHCDLKPSNVFLGGDGSVRLGDFGISINSEGTLGTLEHLRGSLRYVPPELLDGARPTPANDVYALGLTILALTVGRAPYLDAGGTTSSVIARIHVERLRFPKASIDRPFSRSTLGLLNRALSKSPEKRPSAAELAEALRNDRGRGREPDRGSAPDRRRGLRRVAAVAVALAVILIARTLTIAPPSGATTAGQPVVPSAAEYCREFDESIESRRSLIETVASDLEQSTSAFDVVRHLLVVYPREFAGIVSPWLDASVTLGDLAPTDRLAPGQLSDLVLADSLQAMTGGKRFLFDGQDGTFDPAELPGELREPARVFSQANERAVERCDDVSVDFKAAKARMSSAIMSNLTNREFIRQLFDDPRSVSLFTARRVSLFLAVARPFFEALIRDHWGWVFEMLDQYDDVRALMAFEHPDLLLEGLRLRPDQAELLGTEAWTTHLSLGIEKLSPVAREGLAIRYSEQLRAVGLDL